MSDERMRKLAERFGLCAMVMARSFEEEMIGRKVKITSDYNGQLMGRSKSSQKGRICVIKRAHLQLASESYQWTFQLAEFPSHPFIGLNEVELIEDGKPR